MTAREPRLPALARPGLDRAGDERDRDGLLDELRADAASRVLVVRGDRARHEGAGLHWAAPGDVTGDAEWAFLGRDARGAALLLASVDPDVPAPASEDRWAALRTVGGELDAEDAGAFVEAVSLARWLREAPFCPACGSRTWLRSAGWSRLCPTCGRQHFPRTDPAVIVAVTSAGDADRLLLGSNAMWADQNRFSTFAGFVEAGESVESAVAREVLEESGVTVSEMTYRGSQAWPYPRSLMLGFHAHAVDAAAARPDGTEIVAVRWFTRAQIAAALAGEGDVRLPGTASIAHRLISDWCEAAT